MAKLTLIVGKHPDDTSVTIVGAIDTESLNIMPLEDGNAMIEKMKETWTMEPAEYQWREVEVSVNEAALLSMFASPVGLEAKIEHPLAETLRSNEPPLD